MSKKDRRKLQREQAQKQAEKRATEEVENDEQVVEEDGATVRTKTNRPSAKTGQKAMKSVHIKFNSKDAVVAPVEQEADTTQLK